MFIGQHESQQKEHRLEQLIRTTTAVGMEALKRTAKRVQSDALLDLVSWLAACGWAQVSALF